MTGPDPATAFPLEARLLAMGRMARTAQKALALASHDQRNQALMKAADAIRAAEAQILAANAEDLAAAPDLSPAMRDRLLLTPERVEAMAQGVADVARLPDPLGRVMAQWDRPNGLKFDRVAVPLGTIGIIYESRPNVTADAGALCLKSGNAVILRGGSESFKSSRAIHRAMVTGIAQAGLPESAVQLVETTDRAAVGLILSGLGGAIDLVVPRGGKNLVARVQAEARVPVLAHLDGNNTVYVHAAADLEMAKKVVLNAKMRRTGVCGSAENLLIDKACPPAMMAKLVKALLDAGCAVKGDSAARAADARVTPLEASDWDTEYLDAVIAVGEIGGLDDAITHIETHGSHHTDAIITEDQAAAEKFLARIDSAIVLWNASTQYADGGEFGFGAEIGIATGKLHARGPVGVEQLTSFKYVVRGTGQTRP